MTDFRCVYRSQVFYCQKFIAVFLIRRADDFSDGHLTDGRLFGILYTMNKLSPAQKQLVLESILRGLDRQKFADWYVGILVSSSGGSRETVPTKDDILGDIEDMLIPNL
jgi:hypothetical protein